MVFVCTTRETRESLEESLPIFWMTTKKKDLNGINNKSARYRIFRGGIYDWRIWTKDL